MKGFCEDIEEYAENNTDFRKVLYTGTQMQLVVMSLQPGEEIGLETHPETDQFFCVEAGVGRLTLDGKMHDIEDDFAIIIPAGAEHNITNTSDTEALKLYTIYSPPHHKDGVEFATKADADASDEHFDGKTTE